MEDAHADEDSEARQLLAAAFDTLPDNSATVEGLLSGVRCRHTRRRRTRALLLAGGTVAVAGAAAVAVLTVNVATASPALAAVTGALRRAEAGSFHMDLTVTSDPATLVGFRSPLRITGNLDLGRKLGLETISNGWQTRIVGGIAYTKILPSQTKQYQTGGKLWTTEPLWLAQIAPYNSPGARLAWDFNSNRPFNPQDVLALLNASTGALKDRGPVTGQGWHGTQYTFSVQNPKDTGGVVARITCVIDVDSKGNIRSLTQTVVFSNGGKSSFTGHFTFSNFGVRVSVTPPPADQTNQDIGVAALQF